MGEVLGYVYSLPFVAGAIIGALTMKLYQLAVCRHLDRTHPLPNGKRRHVPGIARTWIGGLMALAVLGYVILQVNQTEQRYTQLADNVANCTEDLIESIASSRQLNDQRDNLSEEQRRLGLKLDNADSALIRAVLVPPPSETLTMTPAQRWAWYAEVHHRYVETTAPWRARSAQIEQEVATLIAQRRPLPDPRCAHP